MPKPIKINYDDSRYISVKSSEYPDKLFVYDIEEYGRLDIQLVTKNEDNKPINCYRITSDGGINFQEKYSIPLSLLISTITIGY